jgi:Protein of unknown function (DUF3313)
MHRIGERSPFDWTWFADKDDFYRRKSSYRSLLIAPVTIAPSVVSLLKLSLPPKIFNEKVEELNEMARYMTEHLKMSVNNYPHHPLALVDTVGPDTLYLEMALTEVAATNVTINSIGSVAGFFVPGGGALKALASGRVAMEGRVSDALTQELFVEFADYRSDKRSLFSLRDFQRYAHVRVTISDWCDEMAELAATDYSHKVKGAWPITLNPL